jgi:hypothetical protein
MWFNTPEGKPFVGGTHHQSALRQFHGGQKRTNLQQNRLGKNAYIESTDIKTEE